MGVTITIDARRAVAGLEKVQERLRSPELNAQIGKSVAELLKRHLRARNTTHKNQIGGKRTNFWARASEKVNWRAESDGATVNVSQEGVLQRFRGGTIRPVNAKMLAIPVHPKAYGKSPREFNDLALVTQKNARGVAMLIRRPKGRQIGEVFYVLKRSVTQKADPTVLPTMAELEEAIAKPVGRFLTRQG